MIYLLFFKILGGNCLILKFKEELWTTPNLKGEKCFYPKFVFVFLFFVCKTKHFYAWRKKNTKSQPKKTVHEIMNFVSTKLTKKKKKILKTQ